MPFAAKPYLCSRKERKGVMAKKTKKSDKPDVHDHLDGFDIRVDAFGEMQSNLSIDRLNQFLDENVEDKKLKFTQEEEE